MVSYKQRLRHHTLTCGIHAAPSSPACMIQQVDGRTLSWVACRMGPARVNTCTHRSSCTPIPTPRQTVCTQHGALLHSAQPPSSSGLHPVPSPALNPRLTPFFFPPGWAPKAFRACTQAPCSPCLPRIHCLSFRALCSLQGPSLLNYQQTCLCPDLGKPPPGPRSPRTGPWRRVCAQRLSLQAQPGPFGLQLPL